MENLGKWIKDKYGTQGAFAEELGVQQSRVSKWLGGESIPKGYQEKIRDLKYKGPWPKESAQEVPEGALTREEFAEWRGYWKGGMETVLARIEALEDQVRKLSQPGKAE